MQSQNIATQTTRKDNLHDSMISTWRNTDRSQWTSSHWLLDLLGTHLKPSDGEVPIFSKKEKIQSVREWTVHLWILFHALFPYVLQ